MTRVLSPTKLLAGFGAMLVLCAPLPASEQISPLTGCEADWINRSNFNTLPTLRQLEMLEMFAQRGRWDVQLRLGYVEKTKDGQWEAPKDNSYALHWLEKAKAQGSKTAEWRIIRLRSKEHTHEAYLRSMMAAAEEEGNPWAASELMDLTNGRRGSEAEPTRCIKEEWSDQKCAPEDTLTIDTARKWAEIAAKSGNPSAQEWLCTAAYRGKPERGQPQDDQAAVKWCQMAARNACSYYPVKYLFELVEQGKITDPKDIEQINIWRKQPWRNSPADFFIPYFY